MSERTPCITLWQPWASWVALGWKTIETRTHQRFASLNGKWVAIHAAKKWDNNAERIAVMTADQREKWKELRGVCKQDCGGIVAFAHVSGHRKLNPLDNCAAMIDCATERYGLVFDLIKPVPVIKANGAQGIWYLNGLTTPTGDTDHE